MPGCHHLDSLGFGILVRERGQNRNAPPPVPVEMREDMTERDATGIELLLSQPEIVAWLEEGHSTVDEDARVDEMVDTTS
jgi:hypothetical protein